MTWPFLGIARGFPPSLSTTPRFCYLRSYIYFWRRLSPPGHAERDTKREQRISHGELLNPQNRDLIENVHL